MAFLSVGQPQDAATDFSRYIEDALIPRNDRLSFLILRGIAFVNSKEFEKALLDFDTIIGTPECTKEDKANSLILRATILTRKSKWTDAFQSIDQAFQLSPLAVSESTHSIIYVIGAILHSAQTNAGWLPRLTELIHLFSRYDSLAALGHSLVLSLPSLSKANLSDTGLDAWVSLWRELGAPHDELTVPLRLLETGVAFLKTKDEGALFNLPKEERSILRQTLGLPPETAAT